MIKGVPSKKQLEQQIIQENLQQGIVHYSYVKKHGNMLGSVSSKNIILIFIPAEDSLIYAVDTHKLPFNDYSNIKKKQNKDTATVTLSTIQCESTEMTINYPKKEGQKTVRQEWKFQFYTKQNAQKWFSMLKNYKDLKAQANYSNILKSNLNNSANSNINKNQSLQVKQNEQIVSFILSDSKVLGQQQKNGGKEGNNQIQNKGGNNRSNIRSSVIRKTNSEQQIELQQSRLKDAYQIIDKNLTQSKIKPQNESSIQNDWNYRFIKDPTRELVYKFEMEAYNAFHSVLSSSSYKNSNELIYQSQSPYLSIQITDAMTPESKRFKNQYRNYHYILESTKLQNILNVPLVCLIEHLGLVSLVKAKLPKQAVRIKNKRQLEQNLFQLQSKTRISNSVIINGKCVLYDLTKCYGSAGESSRIYVDELDQYMPEFNAKQREKKDKEKIQEQRFYIRPSLMAYFDNHIVPGGNIEAQKNTKVQNEFYSVLEGEIRDISECLSNQEIYILNIFDLKQFLHYRGVNMKFLFKIYQETKNKFVKRYLQTCLVAKIIKDQIYISLSTLLRQSNDIKLEEVVEQQIRYFIQGKTATTNQYWKKVSIQYRALYGVNINTHQLLGGFLLSCLIVLIRGEYDIGCIDKEKAIFKDQGIISSGFLVKLLPKVKSYYRFSSKIVQTVEICKYSQRNETIFKNLENYMSLNSKTIPQSYNVNNSTQYILGYLSDFVAPEGLGQPTLPCSKQIYSLFNSQPPTAPSIKITLNYYNAVNKFSKQQKNRINEKLESQLGQSIQIINYWLEPDHPKVCQFLQKAATYKELCGDNQGSLQLLERAIQIAYKSQAKNNKKIGLQHYVAGCQYLKAGKKKQAIQNLELARQCLQKSQGQENEYALTLLKLSSLQLNNGDTDSCIKLGKDALKNAQKGKMSDTYVIKIYEILCRAYEIKGEKEELKKLSLACGKQFNQTQDRIAFAEMIKIGLTGVVSRLNIDRSKSLLSLCRQLKGDNVIKQQQSSINLLMQKSKVIVIMQYFMQRSQNCEKYLNQYNTKKQQMSSQTNQFVQVAGGITGVVGLDFVEGLHDQKQFQ